MVELRVHGVSGTPPEDLLDRPLVRQVAGDKIAGFYRPRLAEEWTDQAVGSQAVTGPYLEGYVWGGFTSGSPSRALWLLLLPFTMINIAPRLRPAGPPGRRRVKALIVVSRLLALSLTVTFTLAVAGVTIEVLARQCGADPTTCKALPGFFAGWQDRVGPGWRLVFGALAAIGVVVVLGLLSRRTSARYEALRPPTLPEDEQTKGGAAARGRVGGGPDAWDPGLDDRWLWYGKDMVRRQRRIHMSAAMVSVVAIVGPTLGHDPVGSVLFWVAIAGFAGLGVLLCMPKVAGRGPDSGWNARLTLWVWPAALLMLGVALVAAVRTDISAAGTSRVPDYAVTVTSLFGVQIILVLLMFGLTVSLLRAPAARRTSQPLLGGLGGAGLALLSVLLGAALSAGEYLYAWAWVRGSSAVPSLSDFGPLTEEGSAEREVPLSMLVAAVGFGAALGWVIVLLIAFGLLTGIRLIGFAVGRRFEWRWLKVGSRGPDWEHLEGDYPEVKRKPPRDNQIFRLFWLARRVDRAGVGIGLALYPVALLALWLTFLAVTAPWWPWAAREVDRLLELVGPTSWFGVPWLGVAVYLMVLVPVGLVLLGLAMFRVRATRQRVGILWDLASFWPRSIHPFAAPCYAERTVPDLLTRIRYLLSDTQRTRGVVLAAHSQGSVIGAAALMQQRTADEDLVKAEKVIPRVAFLSYGCVLGRLYARYFPAYFGQAELDKLANALLGDSPQIRWRNLWRHSDPLGGPIVGKECTSRGGVPAVVDQHVIDPLYEPVPGDLADPPAGGHSGYPRDPKFQENVNTLVDLLPPHPPGPQAEPDAPHTVM